MCRLICNSLAGKLIRESSRDIKPAMEDLLGGGTLRTQIDGQIAFNQLDYSESAIWAYGRPVRKLCNYTQPRERLRAL